MFTAVLSATVELVDKQLVILVHWLLLGGSPLASQNPNISLSESGNTLVESGLMLNLNVAFHRA